MKKKKVKNKYINSLLIKPAGPDCNMNCDYCFYLDRNALFTQKRKHRMTDNILQHTIRQTMQYSKTNVSICWQGGEPILMGLTFFKKAIAYEKQFGIGKTIGNGLQTNGILLNKEWASFLKTYQFLVGISLDGPKHIHDKYRKDKAGNGTWEIVYKNAQMLLNKGVAVNVLSCINNYSSEFPDEIYCFFKDSGLPFMQFIPIFEKEKADATKPAYFSVTPEKYGEFLCKIFDLWYADFNLFSPTTSIRLFESVFFTYVGQEAPLCIFKEKCGDYLVIEHNGDVFSCDFFVENKWRLGNIKQQSLFSLINSDKQKKFGNLKSKLPVECSDCQWLNHCFGGCLKDRLINENNIYQNYFCKAYKIFFSHADPIFKTLARNWKENQK